MRISITKKLTLGFISVAAIAVLIIGPIGHFYMKRLTDIVNGLWGRASSVKTIDDLQLSLSELCLPLMKYIATAEKERLGDYEHILSIAKMRVVAVEEDIFIPGDKQDTIRDIMLDFETIVKFAQQVIQLQLPDKKELALSNFAQISSLIEKMNISIDSADEDLHRGLHQIKREAQKVVPGSLNIFLFTIFGIIAFSIIISFLVARKLTRPILRLRLGTQKIAEGDLDYKVKIESSDEIGDLARSFNRMAQELKRSREELVRAKDYTDNIIKSMIDTLIVVDPEGKIRTVNRATEDLLGYEEKELVGKPVEILFEEEEKELILKCEEQAVIVKGGSICNYDMNYRAKNGDVIPVSFSGAVMKNKEGEVVGIVGIARDMREIERLETQLNRSEKLASLGQMAAGVAHEINNPLNVISGHAEMLSMKSKDEEVKRATKVIMEQVKRTTTITDRLLEFSKQKEPKSKRVDINEILEDTLRLSEYQTNYQNIRIIKKLSSNLPQVMADSGQLQEVFLNIILNAVQAMPNGGELNIRTWARKIGEFGRRKTDRFKRGSEIVVIEFEDTGEGIREERLKMIFDPFFSTKERGTGLGLSICHGIIESHQGTIEAKSKVGEGTTFIIQLPVQKEKGIQNG